MALSDRRFRLASTMRKSALLAWALVFAACGDPSAPREEPLDPVVFAASENGFRNLFRLESGSVTRLTNDAVNHASPSVAAAGLAFASDRHGGQDIFFQAHDAVDPRRITVHAAADEEPSLHPDGDAIVFVSSRSGTPRLWLTDTLGAAAVALATGSATFTPERAPRWSPDGQWIAFNSTRTGTSQVWLIPAAGGEALQLSRESAGAFEHTWSPDGSRVIYMTPAPRPRLRSVARNGTDARDFASAAADLWQPSCGARSCVAVMHPYAPGQGTLVRIGAGDALRAVGGAPVGVLHPAIER